MNDTNTNLALVNFAPMLRLLLLAAVVALLPLAWVWLRSRHADTRARVAALTAVTLFLTFDLIVFGAFTRLSDSGLGCPDWPGCYGHASPLGAATQIDQAVQALPSGPVTWSKAWIEMIHRYLAMTVGVLILAIAAVSWRLHWQGRRPGDRRMPLSPWGPTITLVWVLVQGMFGKFTVTLKLYPAIVTLHLMGGLVLLVLLVFQQQAARQRRLVLAPGLRRLALAAAAALTVQIALGGWVSSNYAVLACSDFPKCNGSWWPTADFGGGFTVLRGLGEANAAGQGLGLPALVAIHLAHRLFAVVATLALGTLAWRLWRATNGQLKPFGVVLAALLLAQLVSGLSNVILGWPLLAALMHSAGAAALVLTLSTLLARAALTASSPRAGWQPLPA
jgi:heme a synthase